ncbi:hypothetical protein FACS1894217_01990 [Clostridia bacterium]|nr:hypothetical protein FACS1894217_01990 [Clostridia bacterium]
MTKDDVPRLCGGTFFTQLLLSRKPTVSQRQRTQGETDVFHNGDVLFALLQIIQPDALKPTGNSFETYTTNFKKCDGSIGEDLKFENDSVMSAFAKRIADDYATVQSVVVDFCTEYLDLRETSRKHEKLIKRLIELIRDDTHIGDSDLFQIDSAGRKVNKETLQNITEVSLPDFLLSVWAFAATSVKDNSIGKDTVVAWSDHKTKGRYVGIDGTSIQQDIVVLLPTVETVDASVGDEPFADYGEPYDEPAVEEATQTVNNPVVFNQYGNNNVQISSIGTLTINNG